MNVALVTGATGFVGSRLVKKLVCDGWVVHIIVRDGSKLTELKEIVGDIHIHEYDGSSSSMTEIVSSSNPSVVFHLASLFLSEHKSDQINDLIDSNITFGTQLLEAMVTCQVYNLVNTGTSWQHYQNEQYSPVNLYAATKQAFENIVQYYVEARISRSSPINFLILMVKEIHEKN
jgi:nucleoside-diphosphate-sugar epimerase